MSGDRSLARPSLVDRLDARDRALFSRWSAGSEASEIERLAWTAVTHAGGVACSILIALLPLLIDGVLTPVGTAALSALVVSHLVVQAVKRTVGRPRPSRRMACEALIEEPDRFSFPSGHAAAAMSVAFIYAVSFPTLAAPLLMLATIVGMSRVCLGVHYPGDVLAGQVIALATGAAIVAM